MLKPESEEASHGDACFPDSVDALRLGWRQFAALAVCHLGWAPVRRQNGLGLGESCMEAEPARSAPADARGRQTRQWKESR